MFSGNLIMVNVMQEGSEELHIAEGKYNCCGWMIKDVEHCNATNITSTINTCYEDYGSGVDECAYRILFYSIGYVVLALITMVVLIMGKKSEEGVAEEKSKSD